MNFHFDIKKLKPEVTTRRIIFVIGVIVVAILVFQAGVFVGYRKAAFSFHFDENYYHEFDSQSVGMGGFSQNDFLGANGAVGKIIKITPPTFVVAGRDNLERVILVSDDTLIRRFRNAVSPNDLQVDDYVVVIGSPNNQGQIDAKLVRLLPTPPAQATSTVATSSQGLMTPTQ
jgi:hypothetical protein